MIGYLSGTIRAYDDPICIIEQQGVGWEVFVGSQGWQVGDTVSVHVQTIMKESDITLWGFAEALDKRMFNLLLQVSGVGGKTSFALVQEKGIPALVEAIRSDRPQDVRVSGVGNKTAEKIILELRNKVDGFGTVSIHAGDGSSQAVHGGTGGLSQVAREAVDAMVGLGYLERDIREAVQYLDPEERKLSTQELVKVLLRKL